MRNLWVFVLLATLLFTQGCTTVEYRDVPVYVSVETPVYCITEIPKEPRYATKELKQTDSLEVVADAYMVEKYQREIEAKQLRASLVGCVKP